MQYELGDLIDFSPIMAGQENSNFKLKTSSGNYVLTMFEQRANMDAVAFAIEIGRTMPGRSPRLARALENTAGHTITQYQDRDFSLFEWLDGHHERCPCGPTLKTIGKALALFHGNSGHVRSRPKNAFGLKFCRDAAQSVSERREIEKIAAEIDKHPTLPCGIIHGDLFFDNILLEGNLPPGFIDLYFACWDILLLDVAIALVGLCSDNGRFSFAKARFFIQGYQQIRQLTLCEKARIGPCLKLAAMRFAFTRRSDVQSGKKPQSGELKLPDEFFDLVTEFGNTASWDRLFDEKAF